MITIGGCDCRSSGYQDSLQRNWIDQMYILKAGALVANGRSKAFWRSESSQTERQNSWLSREPIRSRASLLHFARRVRRFMQRDGFIARTELNIINNSIKIESACDLSVTVQTKYSSKYFSHIGYITRAVKHTPRTR